MTTYISFAGLFQIYAETVTISDKWLVSEFNVFTTMCGRDKRIEYYEWQLNRHRHFKRDSVGFGLPFAS